MEYKMDLQASVYTHVLQEVLAKDLDYRDYHILPYLFMDISRNDKVPATYIYDPQSRDQMSGLCYAKGDRVYQYKGWEDLLEEILEYEESQAKVPSYITTTGPNDLLSILSYGK